MLRTDRETDRQELSPGNKTACSAGELGEAREAKAQNHRMTLEITPAGR